MYKFEFDDTQIRLCAYKVVYKGAEFLQNIKT